MQREPELEHEAAVLAQARAHVRTVDRDVDARRGQGVRRAHPGQLQELRGGECAGGENHLASRPVVDRPAGLPRTDADGGAVLDQHPVDRRVGGHREVRPVLDRMQEGVGGAAPAPVADRGHRVADPFLVGLVEVDRALPAEFGAGGDDVFQQLLGSARRGHPHGTPGSPRRAGTERVVLNGPERLQHGRRIRGQPVGEHAAGGSRSDHDVVERFRGWSHESASFSRGYGSRAGSRLGVRPPESGHGRFAARRPTLGRWMDWLQSQVKG
jgi:hypothetical protein